jgi:hypothetical protein
MVEASNELLNTYVGVMGVVGLGFAAKSLKSASSVTNPEKPKASPCVLCSDASFPAKVLMLIPLLSTLMGCEAVAPCIPLSEIASVSARITTEATIFINYGQVAFSI